ncbi:hypothetical protein D1BOALGB6SA_3556 [Olavius sp. associated proteobacterium Delta 1]|nr:hypothetical protein D1BOALGB6SA_3556 [Olavius sp. associated proteobacterium Delta 1]
MKNISVIQTATSYIHRNIGLLAFQPAAIAIRSGVANFCQNVYNQFQLLLPN